MSATLITWFVTLISSNLRQRKAQLAQACERHLQTERIVSLGAKASAC